MLSHADLFARLAEGHAARITVVTPNRRLAQTLTLEFDAFQVGKGLSVWEAADILPFGAFVERFWEDALYSEASAKLPLLLTPAQEQLVWEEILAGASLLSPAQTASQCRDAWRLRHAWRIPAGGGAEDAAAFQQWAKQYEARTRGETDAARLPDVVSAFLPSLKLPGLVVAYGFDILPPQTRELLEKFELARCAPATLQGSVTRTSFLSGKHELETAAGWARARLEEGRARIGVVVPDLAKRRKEVLRVFSRVMQPGYNLPGSAKAPLPFNVSLGAPLADCPLVAFALSFLQLSFSEQPFAGVSRLVRSPFLGGAEAEMTARARLDAKLRRSLGATVTLPGLIASAEQCPGLRALLENVFLLAKDNPQKQSAGAWARRFSALLDAAGFPGERVLDSDEFQTRAKWNEALAEIAKLDRITKEFSIREAFSALYTLCADTLFQPESVAAPVQVLGILESAGLRFDCLWVSGLTDQAWPMDAHPNPFIPVALQKKAGIPEASAEASLALDRRLTEEWKHAAAEVVFSFPAKEEDRNLSPSPLIADAREGTVDFSALARYRDALHSKRKLVEVEDPRGPVVPPGEVRGGTRVLADQAACPFRAFAHWRLNAERLEEPAPGLDARDRGTLLHSLMKHLWTDLKGSAALRETNLVPVIEKAAAAAVREIGLEGRFAELERARLAKLADEWLDLEKGRKDFEVAFLERSRALKVGALEFKSRIDRMDRLKDGSHVLIDYKTGGGMLTPKQWQGPRPDDPQLPLYAAAAEEELSAVAFARLRPGAMAFVGYSRAPLLIPNVKPPKDYPWLKLLQVWRTDAEALGASFAAGEAGVDPKRDLKTCTRCDLQTLCRVYEKFSALEETGEGEEGE